jgi:hypothetical protein
MITIRETELVRLGATVGRTVSLDGRVELVAGRPEPLGAIKEETCIAD